MTGANRKNPEPRHLPERYTLRRRILSSKFTRAGDRHIAHREGEEPESSVGASGSPSVTATTSAEDDLPVAPTEELAAPPKEAQL